MPLTLIQITGDDNHDAIDQDRGPIKIGGKASAATPAAVTAGDRVNAYFDTEGYQHVKVDGTVTVSGGGTAYTEGDTDASFTGNIALAEGSADTARPIQVFELGSNYALKAAIVDGSGNQITSFGGGSQYTEGTATTAAIGNVFLWKEASNSLTSVSLAKPLPISIAATVTTALPNAAALADNTANPTVPGVGAYMLGWDGANWDRIVVGTPAVDNVSTANFPGVLGVTAIYAFDGTNLDRVRLEGSLQGVMMGGSIAHDAADSGNPISLGLNARQTNPNAVADADRVRGIADDIGRQLVLLGHARDLQTQTTTDITSVTTETILMASGGSGIFYDIASLDITNYSQFSCVLSIRDATAGSVVYKVGLPPKGNFLKSFPRGAGWKMTTANSVWTAQLDTVASVTINLQAEKNV